MKQIHRMIDEIRKWMPFTPSAQVTCLGVSYDCSEEAAREQFLEDFRSRILFTYRSGLEPPLQLSAGGTKASDSGWGCMLRVTQMMLAQCFVSLLLGREWRFREEADLKEGSLYMRITSCFLDLPNAPFSLPGPHGQVFGRASLGKMVEYEQWKADVSLATGFLLCTLLETHIPAAGTLKSARGLRGFSMSTDDGPFFGYLSLLSLEYQQLKSENQRLQEDLEQLQQSQVVELGPNAITKAVSNAPAKVPAPKQAHDGAKERSSQARHPIFSNGAEIKAAIANEMCADMHYDVKNLYKTSGCFQRLARSAVFENTTMVMITIYAIYMSVDTDWNTADLITETHPFFIVCEQVFCLYFVFELLVRFGAFQRKCNAFKDAWFVFDFILVVMMVAETWVMNLIILTMASAGASNFLGDAAILRIARLMRLTRLLRMARLIRMVPELLIMVKAVASAARSVGFTLILLGICLYVFAIAFRAVLDGTQVGATYFPNVAVAMHSLFVHGTFLDNIAELFKQMKEQSAIGFSLLYVFVIMSAVTIMNMLIGVLCEVITAVADAEKEALQVSWTTEVLQRCLQAGADTDNDGCIDIDEFQQMISTPKVLQVLKEADVDVSTLVNFADVLFEGDDEQLMTKVPFKDFMTRLLKFRGTNTATVKDLVDLRKCITKELQQVQENAGNSAHPAEFILHV
ncbi:unnamed protein product [Effrenium voratum]|nr:unnamed protein product [Effrenium voratum]